MRRCETVRLGANTVLQLQCSLLRKLYVIGGRALGRAYPKICPFAGPFLLILGKSLCSCSASRHSCCPLPPSRPTRHSPFEEQPRFPPVSRSIKMARKRSYCNHLMDDRMWYSSTHIQGHRGRIGSTRIASPSTALAPPSLACPLPPAGFAVTPCRTTESFHSCPIPPPPHYPMSWYRYWRSVRGEIPTLFCEG